MQRNKLVNTHDAMNKYLLFEYFQYDCRGGFHDFSSSHETIDDAMKSVRCTYWHVIDRDTLECVAGNDKP